MRIKGKYAKNNGKSKKKEFENGIIG